MAALTKLDIAAIRSADALCIHLTSHDPTGLVRLIKRRDINIPFSEDREHVIADCPVRLYGFHNQRSIANGAKCFAHIALYGSQCDHATCVLGTLRVGDEISFLFYPDGHLNDYARTHDLHADILYLEVSRGAKRFQWLLDTQICPENSARMCAGVGRNVPEYTIAQ